jgi:hypothetical protein
MISQEPRRRDGLSVARIEHGWGPRAIGGLIVEEARAAVWAAGWCARVVTPITLRAATPVRRRRPSRA